jgi:hypothetical protein
VSGNLDVILLSPSLSGFSAPEEVDYLKWISESKNQPSHSTFGKKEKVATAAAAAVAGGSKVAIATAAVKPQLRGAIHQLINIMLQFRSLVLLPVSTMPYVVKVKNNSYIGE